ncbi:hypothetical protein V6N13_060599 [Hibiscus sabdariffa]|uniref:FAF domain-containing protein n=1 Tax=Hibiscus sabdariffa TaxID=183260 RepID=A0ABR2P7E9_9ROSI
MATIVCHHHHRDLQSCLESHTVEPRALRLTLSSSRPHFSPPSLELTSKSVSVNSSPEPGGWSVLQALFDGPRLSKEIEGNGNTYALPLAKRSLSAMSDKSLELCTENLGSETGSDDVIEDDNDVFSLSSSTNRQSKNRATWKQLELRHVLGGKKATGGDFPPPLTTISGSESIRVRPHRENGRLVIKAEKAPCNNSIFRAERSNGRLRLCILKDSTPSIDYKEESTTDKENDINNNHNEDEEEEEEFENDGNTIAEKDELDKEETKFERREGRDGRGGGGGRCRGGEQREEQRIYSGFACMI